MVVLPAPPPSATDAQLSLTSSLLGKVISLIAGDHPGLREPCSL